MQFSEPRERLRKALASKLAERGQSFLVVRRSEERLRRDFGRYEPLVEYCASDLTDSANAARAAAAVDTLFYTVGVTYPQFQQHPKLTGVALKAAEAADCATLRPCEHGLSVWGASTGVRERISSA